MNLSLIFSLFFLTFLFWAGILFSAPSADAHSLDYCISILQDKAREVSQSNDNRSFKLREYSEYADYEKECDASLKAAGLFTLTQVKEKTEIAKLVLDGDVAQDILDQSILRRRNKEQDQREGELLKLRQQICTNPSPSTSFACPKQAIQNLTSSQRVVAAAQADDRAIVGEWQGPIEWPIVPIHISLGPNGKVIAWQRPKLAPSGPQSIIWNPSNNTFSNVPPVPTDIFCAGHAFAPSGRLLVAGGHEGLPASGDPTPADVGSDDTNVYAFNTNSWFSYPNSLNKGRWYPTVTYLANGEAVVIGGTNTNDNDVNTIPQIWNGAWRNLTTANLPLPANPSKSPWWNYAWNYLAPDGKVFSAGPAKVTRLLDPTGTGTWSSGSPSGFGDRYYGSSVMYDDGKVMILGGSTCPYCSNLPTNTAEVIDLSQPTPLWISLPTMTSRRKHPNATLLPNGQVLVTGGTSGGGFNKFANRVLTAEIWDPNTTNWAPAGTMSETRLYHSTAILLPDGRVMVGGGGLPLGDGEAAPGTDFRKQGHYNVEFYSPAYLFQGPRPVISSAPSTVTYGQEFTVTTPSATSSTSATWIRLPSVTHGFNANQRINRLTTRLAPGGLFVKAPSNRNLCPPGHYMLFILNNGVPSIAKIIQIG